MLLTFLYCRYLLVSPSVTYLFQLPYCFLYSLVDFFLSILHILVSLVDFFFLYSLVDFFLSILHILVSLVDFLFIYFFSIFAGRFLSLYSLTSLVDFFLYSLVDFFLSILHILTSLVDFFLSILLLRWSIFFLYSLVDFFLYMRFVQKYVQDMSNSTRANTRTLPESISIK